MQRWVVAPYRIRQDTLRPWPVRYCALDDILPKQRKKQPPSWSEAETLGNMAVALVDHDDLSGITGDGFHVFPDMPLIDNLADHLNRSDRQVVKDILLAMGYTQGRIRSQFGTSMDTPLATLDGVLRFASQERRAPRTDENGDIFVDGEFRNPSILPRDLRAFVKPDVVDDFNRTDESPVAGWTAFNSGLGLPRVVSNACQSLNNAYGYAVLDGSSFTDVIVGATIVTTASNDYMSIGCRITDENTTVYDGYEVDTETTGTFYFYEYTDGTSTLLGSSISDQIPAGNRWAIELIGSSFKVWEAVAGDLENFSEWASRTDTTHTGAGLCQIGFGKNVGAMVMDDYFTGAVVSGAVQVQDVIGAGIIPWAR